MPDPAKQWRKATAKTIKRATWGHAQNEIDVTEKVRAVVAKGDRIAARVAWLGEPDKGEYKTLWIQVEDGERRDTYVINERQPLPAELFNPPPSARQIHNLYDKLDFIRYLRDAGEYLECQKINVLGWHDAQDELTILIARLKDNSAVRLYQPKLEPDFSVPDIQKRLTPREVRDEIAAICQSVKPVISAKPILNWLKHIGSSKPQGKPGNRGRPSLDAEDAAERSRIVKAWERAKGAGVTQKQFCKDAQISVKALETYVNWHTKRRKRKA